MDYNYKKNLINDFLNKTKRENKFYSSNIKDLDIYLGGGFNPGSIVGIGGNYSTGKTTLALQIALNYLNKNDKNCLYIDSEHSLSRDYLDNLKVNKEKFIYADSYNLKDTQELIIDSIKSNLFGVIIIDSINGFLNENLFNNILDFYLEIQQSIINNKILLICIEQEDIQKYNDNLLKLKYRKLLYFYKQYIGLYLINKNENYSNIEIKTFKNDLIYQNKSIQIKLDHHLGFN